MYIIQINEIKKQKLFKLKLAFLNFIIFYLSFKRDFRKVFRITSCINANKNNFLCH